MFSKQCVSGTCRFTRRSNSSRAASSLNKNCLSARPVPRTIKASPLPALALPLTYTRPQQCLLLAKIIKVVLAYLATGALPTKAMRLLKRLGAAMARIRGYAKCIREANDIRLASSALWTRAGRTCAVFRLKLSCGPYKLQGMTHIHTKDSPVQAEHKTTSGKQTKNLTDV